MGWIQRAVGALLMLALIIAAFIFASVVLAIAAVAALILWGWLAWRLRGLRRAVDRADGRGDGAIIEGEYRVESETTRIGGSGR